MPFPVSFALFAFAILLLSFAFMVLLKAVDEFMPNLSGLVYNWGEDLIARVKAGAAQRAVTNRGVKNG
jgi:hypothetical protein